VSEIPPFFEKVVRFEEAAQAQQWPPEKVVGALEQSTIGMLRLGDDQALVISVNQGAISRFGELIAEIPSPAVLRTPEALVRHIRESTGLDAVKIETLKADSAQHGLANSLA